MSYDSYGDWYDNGPGSEAFKRSCRQPFTKLIERKSKMTIECKRCRFFKNKQGTGQIGECRRKPPVKTITGSTEYPDVKPTQWCGEFRGKLSTNGDK